MAMKDKQEKTRKALDPAPFFLTHPSIPRASVVQNSVRALGPQSLDVHPGPPMLVLLLSLSLSSKLLQKDFLPLSKVCSNFLTLLLSVPLVWGSNNRSHPTVEWASGFSSFLSILGANAVP